MSGRDCGRPEVDNGSTAGVKSRNHKLGSEFRAGYGSHRILAAIMLVAGAAVSSCQDEIPTASDPGLVPISPLTIEVLVPADEFISDVQVVNGFGLVSGLPISQLAVANDYTADAFRARTLIRFPGYPTVSTVQDSTGATVVDSSLVYLDGEIRLNIDTLRTFFDDSLRVSIGAITQAWDARTATWNFATDSLASQIPWGEPGAGPVRAISESTWRPALNADTLRIPVDSLTIAEWSDTSNSARGVRIDAVSSGTILRFLEFELRVNARPSSNPDTIVPLSVTLPQSVTAQVNNRTFIYDPEPTGGDPTVLRVGGAPAFRTYMTVSVPTELTGPPELCAQVTCPLALEPELINSAQLLLRTRASPPAFQPADTLFRLRPQEVREPDRIPRTPLGRLLASGDVEIPRSFFSTQPGAQVEVPLTSFVQNLLAGPQAGEPVPSEAFVLLTPFEPSSLGFASFDGLGTANAPVLRMVLTVGERVGFR